MNWKAFLLRRLLGRLRIDDDTIRHLSTFQRLGETLEATPPTEMLPVGARTMLRAVRTRAASQIRPDWVWPYWLERQLDPRSESFIPRGHIPTAINVTHRNWTMIGNTGSSLEAIVDPRGLVTPWFDGWSLEWAVHAGDAWLLPSRVEHTQQRLVGSAPVVETSLGVPGGAVRHRAYAVRDGAELIAAEVSNDSNEAVQVVFALRPYNPEGLAVVEDVQVKGTDVLADGRMAMILPGQPVRAALSTFATGDSLRLLIEDGGGAESDHVHDRAGLAQGAFLYPLPPNESVRMAMPLQRERRVVLARSARRARRDGGRGIASGALSHLDGAARVGERWHTELDRGMRVEVPDRRLQDAIEANRAYMLLFLDGDEITPGPFTYHRFWFRDAAYQLVALDRWGFHDEAARVIASFGNKQRADGFFYSQWREWDSNGAALWAIAEHHRIAHDDALVAHLANSIRKGAEWIRRKRAGRRRAPELEGLLPAGISAEHLGPFDYYYWDDFWSLKGLLDAGMLLKTQREWAAAEAAQGEAAALRDAIAASLEIVAKRIGENVMPAGPSRGLDAGMIGSLVACYPLGVLDPHDPWVEGTVAAIHERFTIGDGFYQGISHTGLGTYLTLQLAFVELAAGDPRAWQRLTWLLDSATPTFTWPEAIHPRTGGGCMGDGHHGWAAADFLSFIRNLLVRETEHDSIALMSLLPQEWRGQRVRVDDAPTHHGRLSFTLEWHDDAPELSWECDKPGIRVTAPALDQGWVGSGSSGRHRFS